MSASPESAANNIDSGPPPVTPGTTRTAASRTTGGQESASRRRPVGATGCGGCSERWTAPGAAHCGGCHRTFSAAGLFDRHRSAAGEHGRCLDPATIDGIEFRDGMWRGPEMTDAERERVAR